MDMHNALIGKDSVDVVSTNITSESFCVLYKYSCTFPVTYSSLMSGSNVGIRVAGEMLRLITDFGVERSVMAYRLSVRVLLLVNPVTRM